MRHELHDERLNEIYLPEECPEEPRYEETALVCPACLEFSRRGYPLSQFREARLWVDQHGAYRCPVCEETYADAAEVATRAVDNLKDALDDQAFLRGELAKERAA